MGIEELATGGEINIKGISTELAKKREIKYFDPTSEMPKEFWEYAKKKTQEYSGWTYCEAVALLKVLNPDAFEELSGKKEDFEVFDSMLSPDMYRPINEVIQIDQNLIHDIIDHFLQQRILFPKEEVVINKAEEQAIVKMFYDLVNEKNVSWTPIMLWKFYLINPKIFDELMIKKDELWENINELLEKEKLSVFLDQLLALKLIDKQRYNNIIAPKIDLSQSMEVISKTSENKAIWRGTLSLLLKIKLLMAEEIELTDEGLILTMPKAENDFAEEKQEMPVERSY